MDKHTFLMSVEREGPAAARPPKEYISGPPDITGLNEEQREAYDGLMDWLSDKNGSQIAVLKGYAGTGKTYTVSRLVHSVLSSGKSKVGMMAPTNKAVKVMERMATATHVHLKYLTVHSALALKEEIGHDGKIKFVPDPKREPSISEYDMVVVDEASMVSQYLMDLITGAITSSMKILYVGDPAQIPPVDESDGAPMSRRIKMNGAPVYELTRIVRQAEGNPLIRMTMGIREAIQERKAPDLSAWDIETAGIGGVVTLQAKSDEEKDILSDTMERWFTGDEFDQDTDFAKLVAWTNKAVDRANVVIRRMRYGDNVGKLVNGELLIADGPIMRGQETMVTSNAEMRVVEFAVATERIAWGGDEYHPQVYRTVVEFEGRQGPEQATIDIIHEDDEEGLNEILKMMADHAKSRPPATRKLAWLEFFNLKRKFASVKHAYAITAHRAQGSTYTNVIVMRGDIAKNRDVRDMSRILYTACSRASEKLLLVG